jgi:hypothetical protein
MKYQKGILAIVAIAALALVACGDTYNGGDNITNNNFLGGGQPSASPSPGGSGSCPVSGVIASIRVSPFGYQCQAGVPVPNNSSGTLPAGCTAIVTATPKDATGRDVPDNVHGPNIVWATEIGAALLNVDDFPGQAFNKNVTPATGVTSGEFRLAATVCGVTGAWNGRVVP